MDYGRPELADRLAAEYAAGLLRGPARRRFEALLPAHPLLRAASRAWLERLMPLTATIEPQTPSPALWPRIEARLDGGAADRADRPPRATAWLGFWRGLAGLATVAAVALGVMLMNPGAVAPPIVVVLAPAAPTAAGATVPSFVASISADGRAMVTKPLINVGLQPGKSLELWSLPPSGAPRSLGLIAADQATVVQRGKVLDGTSALAVSLEAAGGSPDGTPHGPILYVGKLTN